MLSIGNFGFTKETSLSSTDVASVVVFRCLSVWCARATVFGTLRLFCPIAADESRVATSLVVIHGGDAAAFIFADLGHASGARLAFAFSFMMVAGHLEDFF